MTRAAPSNYVWWLAGRSAGMVAMLLIASSVIIGLAMAARAIPPRRRAEVVRLHQHLALIALGAVVAHGLLLAADPWLKAGIRGIVLPFALGYRPFWTGLGILAGYLAAILGLSFYVRRRIGARLWRRMHRFTVVVYVLALAHAVGSGTDASIPAVRYAMLASTLPVVFLFALRLRRTRTRVGASRSALPSAPSSEMRGSPGPNASRGASQAGQPSALRARGPGRRPTRLPVVSRRGHIEPHPSEGR